MALASQTETIWTQTEQLQKQEHVVQEILSTLQRQNLQLKRQNQFILTLKRAQKIQEKAVAALFDKMENDILNYMKDETQQTDHVAVQTNKTRLAETGGRHFRLQTSNDTLETERTYKRQILNNGEQVAFHAVITKGEVPNFGANQNIVFDVVLLNLGGAYHSQHGVFIAPKQGLYIFSVSILSFYNTHPEVQANLNKNGDVLARVFAHGDNGREDQGSVTIVTQMALADEVWVSLLWPHGDSIYGDKYTTFSGCLIDPMVNIG